MNNNKYEKITLEELGILGDDAYNPKVWEPFDEDANWDSLHREVDKQVREGSYLDLNVRYYKKGDRVRIATNCSEGVKWIAGKTMYVTESIYGDKPYFDCYHVSEEMNDGIFWVVCHSDIEGLWREYDYVSGGGSGVDRDGDNENCPVMDTMLRPNSLAFTVSADQISPGRLIKNTDCNHKIELRSFKREFVTYCTICGKILHARKKRK